MLLDPGFFYREAFVVKVLLPREARGRHMASPQTASLVTYIEGASSPAGTTQTAPPNPGE